MRTFTLIINDAREFLNNILHAAKIQPRTTDVTILETMLPAIYTNDRDGNIRECNVRVLLEKTQVPPEVVERVMSEATIAALGLEKEVEEAKASATEQVKKSIVKKRGKKSS